MSSELDRLIERFETLLRTKESKQWLQSALDVSKEQRARAAITHYYASINLWGLGHIKYARQFCDVLVSLIGGFTDSDRPKLANGFVLIPRSYLSMFSDAEASFSARMDRDKDAERFSPIASFSGDLGFGERAEFKKNTGRYDFWPVKFDQRDGKTLSRDQIADVLLSDILSRSKIGKIDTTRTVALGSCFALNLANALEEQGVHARALRIEEDVNSARANRLLLEYILNGRTETEFFASHMSADDRGNAKEELKSATAIVITLGVAVVLERKDGTLFLGKPRPAIESGEATQRMTTVDENVSELISIIDLLRHHNADADIVVTLSPVPLIGVSDDTSVIISDAVSKSTLRVAMDLAGSKRDFIYWPSFEVFKWVSPHISPSIGYAPFGDTDGNSRHPSRWIIKLVVGCLSLVNSLSKSKSMPRRHR